MFGTIKNFLNNKQIQKKWDPFSKLLIKSDGSDWVLKSITLEMEDVCEKIGLNTIDDHFFSSLNKQSIFFTSKYDVLAKKINSKNRIAFPYFHGDPYTNSVFKKLLNNLEKNHKMISRVQVTNSHIENIILNTGIDKSKVFKIPISIDLNCFSLVDSENRNKIRNKLNIAKDKFVIGSFQKDGVGWGEGNEPKLIKGPDIFLSSIASIKHIHPNIHVMLTGPSRGYVKRGLEKMGVTYDHFFLQNYLDVTKYYYSLDCYLITAREEGGPRAILESMACGIPLVTTKVGQAMDLVEHGINGWMVESEDIGGLSESVIKIIEDDNITKDIIVSGRNTAKKNCYEAQIPLWKTFMNGFVNY